MKRAWVLLLAATVGFGGCGDNDDGTCEDDVSGGDHYDAVVLQTYRDAIPSRDRLTARTPAGCDNCLSVGIPSEYANSAIEMVAGDPTDPDDHGVNGTIGAMIDTIRQVAELPPTLYDSQERKFIWGPWDDDDGVGTVVVFIEEQDDSEDFQFVYGILRGVSRDFSTMHPIILGAANPDPTDPDRGDGLMLWDFENARTFMEEAGQVYEGQPTGRFIALYGRGADEQEADAVNTFVIAAFRGFTANGLGDPASLDYLFGQHLNPADDASEGDFQLDILDVEIALPTPFAVDDSNTPNDPSDDAMLAGYRTRVAFLNEGPGRGEAFGEVTNSPFASVAGFAGTECWDATHTARWVREEVVDADGNRVFLIQEDGDVSACVLPALSETGFPSLDDLRNDAQGGGAELMSTLDAVATQGTDAILGGD